MSPLRTRMIDLMTVKHFSYKTQRSYQYCMEGLVRYFKRPPDELSVDDIQAYLLYLMKEKKVAVATCRLQVQGIRFFYESVLKWPSLQFRLSYPKREQRIPELLSRDEVQRILSFSHKPKYRTMLMVCYGSGLRGGETLALRIKDIDSSRMMLRVEQGKGHKDRYVPLTPTLLSALRAYWMQYRPHDVVFYGASRERALTLTSLQKAYTAAKRKAGIRKQGGLHSLRHAFATHQLEMGLPVHILQRWMGHQDLKTTMRYIHWLPEYRPEANQIRDLFQSGPVQ